MKLQYILIAAALLFVGISMAFDGYEDDTTTYRVYEWRPTMDTLTNTEADTITLPPLFSPWSAAFAIGIDTVAAGAPNVEAKLQGSYDRSTQVWFDVDNDTITSETTVETYSVDRVKYLYYRYILRGLGSQTTVYRPRGVFKHN